MLDHINQVDQVQIPREVKSMSPVNFSPYPHRTANVHELSGRYSFGKFIDREALAMLVFRWVPMTFR